MTYVFRVENHRELGCSEYHAVAEKTLENAVLRLCEELPRAKVAEVLSEASFHSLTIHA